MAIYDPGLTDTIRLLIAWAAAPPTCTGADLRKERLAYGGC
jgi:hypothetical protein